VHVSVKGPKPAKPEAGRLGCYAANDLMVCYRAESSLSNLLYAHFSRARDEGRAFLKGLFELPADILPDKMAGIMSGNFHPVANPRFNGALNELCEIMNQEEFCFPRPG
jgi:hypothetical protein